jgi:hypothetical protein
MVISLFVLIKKNRFLFFLIENNKYTLESIINSFMGLQLAVSC